MRIDSGSARMVKPGTVVPYSRADDVAPFADSEELVKNSRLLASEGRRSGIMVGYQRVTP